ncbi:hypothetical protein O0L34_g18664 [Tuta absoluta]|nr:hypothetical protein O0L34_g18664 [Tuta absoluta]
MSIRQHTLSETSSSSSDADVLNLGSSPNPRVSSRVPDDPSTTNAIAAVLGLNIKLEDLLKDFQPSSSSWARQIKDLEEERNTAFRRATFTEQQMRRVERENAGLRRELECAKARELRGSPYSREYFNGPHTNNFVGGRNSDRKKYTAMLLSHAFP